MIETKTKPEPLPPAPCSTLMKRANILIVVVVVGIDSLIGFCVKKYMGVDLPMWAAIVGANVFIPIMFLMAAGEHNDRQRLGM